jgi:hypothetical protein
MSTAPKTPALKNPQSATPQSATPQSATSHDAQPDSPHPTVPGSRGPVAQLQSDSGHPPVCQGRLARGMETHVFPEDL